MEKAPERKLRSTSDEENKMENAVKDLVRKLDSVEKRLAEVEKDNKKLKSELAKLKEMAGKPSAETAAEVVKVVQEEVRKESETWAQVASKNVNPGKVVTRVVTDLQDRQTNVII